MRDLTPKFWIGLPLASFIVCVGFAVIGGRDVYRGIISASEAGYLEHSTVLMLLPAIVLSGWLTSRWREFPHWGVGLWCLALFLGSVYFAGEECSWGQNYFGWATPEWMAGLNDQGETNIHNTSGFFDQLPRGLLTAWAAVGVFGPPFLRRYCDRWDPRRDWRGWLLPTMAALPTGLLVLLVGLPQKFYRHYGARDESIPEWFECMFLRGQHSELKEHFISLFIFVYVSSLAYRYWTFRTSEAAKNELPQDVREPPAPQDRAAQP